MSVWLLSHPGSRSHISERMHLGTTHCAGSGEAVSTGLGIQVFIGLHVRSRNFYVSVCLCHIYQSVLLRCVGAPRSSV